MLFDAPEIRRQLHGIVNRLAPPQSREDLIQDAMVYLWRAEEHDPGRDGAWYLQGCRLHLQNVLRLGRSVDSLKRCWRQAIDPAEPVDGTNDLQTPTVPADSVLGEVSVNDFMSELVRWLTSQEKDTLCCLMEGLSARETAQRLHCSHTMINRHRSRIAFLALKLGIAPSGKGRRPGSV